jgi:hypothetical protein
MIVATRRALGGVAHNIAQHANSSSFSPHMARALRAAGLETTVESFLTPRLILPSPLQILGKLGASDRTHAITIAARRGFIHL